MLIVKECFIVKSIPPLCNNNVSREDPGIHRGDVTSGERAGTVSGSAIPEEDASWAVVAHFTMICTVLVQSSWFHESITMIDTVYLPADGKRNDASSGSSEKEHIAVSG